MTIIRLAVLFMALPMLASAQDGVRSAQVAAAGLPAAVVKRIQSSPDRAEEAVVMLIAGSGTGGGISQAQIETAMSLRLADARASVLSRLLAADLDNDGTVVAGELEALAAASGARNRGWLAVAAAHADRNGDGALDAGELRQFAAVEADGEVPSREIATMRGVMRFDVDGDGRVTLAEYRAVAEAAAALPTPPAEEKKGS